MRRALAYWGVETARLVNNAPQVVAIRLVPTGMGTTLAPTDVRSEASGKAHQAEYLTHNGVTWLIDRQQDATHARGLTNLRHMLLQDQAFDWEAPDDAALQWLFVLQFRDAQRTANVWFAPREKRVGRDASNATARLDPGGAQELLSFFREQFDTAAPSQESAR
jgi:hypothetical protein